MFSRFQKGAAINADQPAVEAVKPAAAPSPSIDVKKPEAAEVPADAPKLTRRVPKEAVNTAEIERDAKRKARLLDIRLDIHRKLLETLNLS
ncbi:MAG: CpaF family protein, partial [Pseudomonadota bacterium]